jgi:hypothetical protein
MRPVIKFQDQDLGKIYTKNKLYTKQSLTKKLKKNQFTYNRATQIWTLPTTARLNQKVLGTIGLLYQYGVINRVNSPPATPT